MLHNHGGRHGTPPRGLFPPDMQQSLPPQHAPHQGRQGLGQPPSRPPMMRSATEHDIKIRNRRSMAVGPFEDLPPHIRQHMVSSIEIYRLYKKVRGRMKFIASSLIIAFREIDAEYQTLFAMNFWHVC